MAKRKSTPKLRNGAWFYKKRGSYLPATPEAWLLQAVLLVLALFIVSAAIEDTRSLLTVSATTLLQFIGLGALFSWIASNKS